MTTYRVNQVTTVDFLQGKRDVTTKVIWEGADLDDLSRKYPPSSVFGADPLGHNEFEDGCIRFDHEFERKAEDGAWETIPDPRTRKDKSLTAYERAIDEENRRDFPGDFYDPDDEDEELESEPAVAEADAD